MALSASSAHFSDIQATNERRRLSALANHYADTWSIATVDRPSNVAGYGGMLGRLEDMAQPITVDIPHQVGRAEAKLRLDNGLGQLTSFVPGATILNRQWDGDTLTFVLEALGQQLTSRLDVFDDKVRAIIELPPILALAAAKVRAGLVDRGTKLLR